MVDHSLGDDGRFLSAKWHRIRDEAHRESWSIEEWGDIDRTRYDLDTVEFDTKKKDSTFITDSRLDAEGAAQGGVDVRTIDDAR